MHQENAFQILLYYLYARIPDPEAFVAEHRELCAGLALRGRILVAVEGLNGTVSGPRAATECYMDALRRNPVLKGIEFKIDHADGHVFPKLSIKVREEVVTLGLDQTGEPDVDPDEVTGKHLFPEQWKAALEAGDAIVLDARNNYETKLGRFRGAVCPDLENFRDFPQWIRENLDQHKEKKILTYCTGGIRCEKLSGFLVREGFSDVSQLHGGIINYGNDDAARGRYFDGQCYVFDQRVGVEVNRTDDRTVVGRCVHCEKPIERLVNCRNTVCNDQFFCCDACEDTIGRFCKSECAQSSTLRPV